MSSSNAFTSATFYLDLPASKIEHVTRRIINSGSTVEAFLSKNVDYLVTDGCGQSRGRAASNTTRASSRAATMLRRASAIPTNTPSKLLADKAAALGVRTMTLDTLMKGLAILEASGNSSSTSRRGRSPGRKLKGPFMKLEDRSGAFQPVVKEFQGRQPQLNFDTDHDECPFSTPKRNRSRSPLRRAPPSSPKCTSSGGKCKQGVCELCASQYQSREMHLKGTQHQKNVDKADFSVVDSMAAKQNLADLTKAGFVTPVKMGIPKPGFVTPSKSAMKKNPFDLSSVPTPTKSTQTPTKGSTVTPEDILVGTSALHTPPYNPFTPVTPLKIILSPGSGYSVKKLKSRKRTLPTSSSTASLQSLDGNMVDLKSTSKRMRADDYESVCVSELTLKIKRSSRLSPQDTSGSKIIDYPVFETPATHLDKMATLLSKRTDHFTRRSKLTPIKRSKGASGVLRRSKRLMSYDDAGLKTYLCPMRVTEAQDN